MGLFGILFIIGAVLGIVAFTRLRGVDQNDLLRIPELLRRVAELERRLGIGEEAAPVTAEPVSAEPGPPQYVQPSASVRIRSGWRRASSWATMPPIEMPITCAASMPSASSSPAASCAI